ncbi:acetate/propionate family kinase [Methylomarinum vadi]|uniref:acetate/propionate family kinase n=1 Tax=Methylomarinum vadi TaxID=438855 RepID=UPI0004DFC159|nr:acetate kinase [Methylomarinum vadi]
MKTLVLNSGSSSIKYSLFDMGEQSVIVSGLIERIGEAESRHRFELHLADTEARCDEKNAIIGDHRQGLQNLFTLLSECGALKNAAELVCIGHRVVHGGEHFRQPVLIDADVIEQIRQMIPLAPLHNPANLLGIEQAIEQLPSVPQVAVFDTAFHQTLPPPAYHYAVPADWYRQYGVRRYGFHGTSHYYVAKRAAAHLGQDLRALNLITLHLGNGASMTAIANGQSIDTTMGMTPLEGLIMGTRCGDIDPALPFFLERSHAFSFSELENQFNKHSGLKGICGENDMRAIHRLAEQGNESARLALEMYAYRIKKYLGAYYAALGHVDALVFTGGIGENDTWLRQHCCDNLHALGIEVDRNKNQSGDAECFAINSDSAPVSILVVKTNEELEIALQSLACVQS